MGLASVQLKKMVMKAKAVLEWVWVAETYRLVKEVKAHENHVKGWSNLKKNK
jgi:hypothetical protein